MELEKYTTPNILPIKIRKPLCAWKWKKEWFKNAYETGWIVQTKDQNDRLSEEYLHAMSSIFETYYTNYKGSELTMSFINHTPVANSNDGWLILLFPMIVCTSTLYTAHVQGSYLHFSPSFPYFFSLNASSYIFSIYILGGFLSLNIRIILFFKDRMPKFWR